MQDDDKGTSSKSKKSKQLSHNTLNETQSKDHNSPTSTSHQKKTIDNINNNIFDHSKSIIEEKKDGGQMDLGFDFYGQYPNQLISSSENAQEVNTEDLFTQSFQVLDRVYKDEFKVSREYK